MTNISNTIQQLVCILKMAFFFLNLRHNEMMIKDEREYLSVHLFLQCFTTNVTYFHLMSVNCHGVRRFHAGGCSAVIVIF